MTPNDYWNGDPTWVKKHIDSWKVRKREEWREFDEKQRQLGQYIRIAIVSALDSGTKYPDESLFYEPTEQEKIDRIKAKHARLFSKMRFGNKDE